ncbi:hypothetical protein [Streptomyces sp. AF1A]|uniref:hypothetical protein n=1 Tax=Streptomyces sp. AF1A TaxID=3394350 RepID=UPI0039BCDC6F
MARGMMMGMTSIAQTPITGLDLTGFTEREPGVWTDVVGMVLSVHFFPLVPDLPAPLHEVERLRFERAHGVARAGGGLIEAVVGTVDGVTALRQLVKMPLGSRPGQAFLGSWTLPKDRCSVVIKVQAAEGGMTGVREAVVADRVGLADYFQPHPYAGGGQLGGLPYHVADLEQWDAHFPDHPLTLVRAALHRITSTVTLHEQFKVLPPFPGAVAAYQPQPGGAPSPYGGQVPPSPPHSGPAAPAAPRRGWFRRKGI